MSHVPVWFSERVLKWFPQYQRVVWAGLVGLCQMTVGTVVRSGGCWCMILCARGRGNTWWEPFHRPVPRTLEEYHFITSKGLSLDLACHMYPCGLVNLYWSCQHVISTLSKGSLSWFSRIMSDDYWYFGAFRGLLVHDSVCKRSGLYMMRAISQTCSENSWGTSFHNI